MKILVVDDDLDLLGLVAFALRQAGYMAIEAPDGRAGLDAFARERPDLVVLDVNMPRVGGLEVLRQIRLQSPATPVMMLTVRADEADQVEALDLGADDYLTKPFSPRTLLARVRALLRRAGPERPGVTTGGALSLDFERQSVSVAGREPVKLTPLEYRLLQLLVANAGRVVAPERLTTHVWGLRGIGDRQLLKQLVHRVRGKIEDDPAAPRHLVTAAGQGYRVAVEGQEAPPDGR